MPVLGRRRGAFARNARQVIPGKRFFWAHYQLMFKLSGPGGGVVFVTDTLAPLMG